MDNKDNTSHQTSTQIIARRPPDRFPGARLLCYLAIFQCVLGCDLDSSATDDYAMRQELPAIVGGSPTEYKIWQGAVGIMIPLGGYNYSICTATLIDPEVILLAGHCVYLPSQGIDVLTSPGSVNIVGGAEMNIHYSLASKIVKHPNWNGDIYSPTRVDLAIIKLKDPIEHIAPYPVDTSPLSVGDKGVIVGYGNSSDEGGAGVHRYGETTILTITETEFELGDPAGTCLGDSGGPLFVDRGENDWVVAGVSSYGTGYGCSAMDSSWDVYILKYRDWIGSVVEEMTGHPLIDLVIDTDENTETDEDTASAQDTQIDSEEDSEEKDTVPDTEQSAETDSEDSNGYPEDPVPSHDTDFQGNPDEPDNNYFGDGGFTTMPFGMNQKNPVDCGCRSAEIYGRSRLIPLLGKIF